MRALQFKMRLRIVVESPFRPVHRVVAERAVARKTTVMGIVIAMAVHAVRGCVRENTGLVTGIARGVRVRAEQRESRQAMIEKDLVGPRVLVVTIIARDALRSFVGIVFCVTRETVSLQCKLENRLDVTSIAFDGLVSTV